jgi:hypothetical protein
LVGDVEAEIDIDTAGRAMSDCAVNKHYFYTCQAEDKDKQKPKHFDRKKPAGFSFSFLQMGPSYSPLTLAPRKGLGVPGPLRLLDWDPNQKRGPGIAPSSSPHALTGVTRIFREQKPHAQDEVQD